MASEKGTSFDMKKFYIADDPIVSEVAKAMFTQYSGIAEDRIVPHRDRAWELLKYPCIGMYSFLEFNITKCKQYPEVLQRVKSGEALLDQGCCFGQDLRKLVFDGAPADNLTGSELETGYIDLGYDMFNDRKTFQAAFVSGDFYQDIGLKEGSFDMIYAGAFFHLFSWDGQVEAASKAVRLLKPKTGSLLFGRQTSVEVAGSLKHPAVPQGEIYRHNLESFRELIDEVAEKTGMKLECELGRDPKTKKEAGAEWRMMMFCVRIQ